MGPIEISPRIALENYGVPIGDTIKITALDNKELTDLKITECLFSWYNYTIYNRKAADATDLYLDHKDTHLSQKYEKALDSAVLVKEAAFNIFQTMKEKHCLSMVFVDLERRGY